MQPPVKDQADGIGADEPTIDCSDLPDMARQEFKEEADINILLRKFGVRVLERSTQPIFAEVDFDLDLLGAYEARDQVMAVHRQLPEEVRNLYPTYADLLNAIEKGEITIHDKAAPQPETPPAVPPA